MNRNDWAVAATLAAFAGAMAGSIPAALKIDYEALMGMVGTDNA